MPFIDVIVCVYNEALLIEDKLQNLEALLYPRNRVHIVVVDGGSHDDTVERVRRWADRHDLHIELCLTAAVGKPAQINLGLTCCHGDWILVTDADARLPATTLQRLVACAARDEQMTVVGTAVRPMAGHPLDHAHWSVANALLRFESRLGSAGLVLGPCYMVRRRYFAPLPNDTIADDVRVSCRALLAGSRIGCAAITVTELRTPTRGRELFRHKVRKARAYMHEMRASLPAVPCADPLPLAVFVWRAALLVTPPLALVVALIALVILAGGLEAIAVSLFAFAIGAASLRGKPGRAHAPGWLRTCVGLPIVTSAVLLTAICLRPFMSVSPRYPRIQLIDRAGEL